MSDKIQFIMFALNRDDSKEEMDAWARRHGHKDSAALAKVKFYEYLVKVKYFDKTTVTQGPLEITEFVTKQE